MVENSPSPLETAKISEMDRETPFDLTLPESADTLRLSTTSYVVLGMVAIRGSSTTYEIQRALERTLGWFWAFTQTSLYNESSRLAELGLLTVDVEHTGRHRKLYTIAPEGLRLVQEWLRTAPDGPMEIRDLAQVKLFFSELTSPEDVVALAHSEVAFYTERIEHLRTLEAAFHGRTELASRVAPIGHGIGIYQAAVAFWENIAANPPLPTEPAVEEEKGQRKRRLRRPLSPTRTVPDK
jgi:DNA-binding PadR family transcriptional regulator